MKILCAILRSRLFAWPVLAVPAVWGWHLCYDAPHHAWVFEKAQDFLGSTALILLLCVLSLTPLRVLFSKSPIIASLNRHRRAIGVSCFLYAAWHVYLFWLQSRAWEDMFNDFRKFLYLQVGLLAFCLLFILFITSNNLIVRLLSYPLWKTLHRLAYIAAILIFIHRAFGNKPDQLLPTTLLFLPLVFLECLRIIRQILNGTFSLISKWRHRPAWKGFREFKVVRKIHEGADICSFYMAPVNEKRLPGFKPGQYLTFSLDLPGREEPLIRCYSLSDGPTPNHYRVSIKKVPAPKDKPEWPPGLSSNFFHNHIQEGSLLRVQSPSGGFNIDPRGHNPIVLIGSGIGLTPVMSMLIAHIHARSKREIWFFYGVRNRREHVMRDLTRDAAAACPNFHPVVCYSSPDQEDKKGEHYHESGRISADLLKKVLPHKKFHFYFCGPGPMMSDLAEGLAAWDVPEQRVHFEAFGPSSIRKKIGAASAKITLRKSKKVLQWDGTHASILETAEAAGVKLRFGCRAGNCGTCSVKLAKGEVVYASEPSAPHSSSQCLACVGIPNSDLEINA